MISQTNILFLCGGRRVKLLQIFRTTLNIMGSGKILTTDTELHSSAAFIADGTYRLAAFSADAHIPHVIRVWGDALGNLHI